MGVDVLPIAFGSKEYDEEVGLRFRVLREPLGLTFTTEQLALERDDLHLGVFQAGALIAGLVLTRVSDEVVQMRQVAVEPALQGQGLGRLLVRESERLAREHGYREMVLHARDTAVQFYLRLGYQVRGKPFEEVGIAHQEMAKGLGPG
jgi:ribosomal protein S18 acetylase RimI-like enzyme